MCVGLCGGGGLSSFYVQHGHLWIEQVTNCSAQSRVWRLTSKGDSCRRNDGQTHPQNSLNLKPTFVRLQRCFFSTQRREQSKSDNTASNTTQTASKRKEAKRQPQRAQTTATDALLHRATSISVVVTVAWPAHSGTS